MAVLARRYIVWFRFDLRVHDNPVLYEAAEALAPKEVLPLFIFDPRYFGTTEFGSPKTGSFRARFLRESVADLRMQLRKLGSDLLVGIGRSEELIPLLVATPQPTAVLWQVQLTSEELAIDRAVRGALPREVVCQEIWGGTLYSRDDLPYEDKVGFKDMGRGSRGICPPRHPFLPYVAHPFSPYLSI